jgi:hypothetical protein
MSMHKRILLPAALLLCAAMAAPAQANFIVGIGEQNGHIFSDARFQQTNVKRIRYLVPIDWYKSKGQSAEVDGFMALAQATRADVLVHFTARRGCYVRGRYSRSKKCRLPTVRAYTSAFKRFHTRFPAVKTFGVWNEANHVSQPTAKNPRRAAQYFLAARKACRTCTIVAADVLDQRSMSSWVRKFLRNAKGKARIFGLHNYVDVNRRRTSGTRELLRLVPGQVWLTETGGILTFLPAFRKNERRQARATKYMFSLAGKYDSRRRGLRSRITRLYNYKWYGESRRARFDAGLVSKNGAKPRKALAQFKKGAARHRK